MAAIPDPLARTTPLVLGLALLLACTDSQEAIERGPSPTATGGRPSATATTTATADLKEIEGKPIAKRGRIPGATANPRLKRLI